MRQLLDTRQRIDLSEGVSIYLPVAGPLPRLLAFGLDILIQIGLYIVAGLLQMAIGAIFGFNFAEGLILLVIFVIYNLYFVILESTRGGATWGKRAIGLRVVQTTGAPATPWQAFVRNLLRIVDLLPPIWGPLFTGLAGLTTVCATRRFQRLGDLAAGTVVVYDALPPSAHQAAAESPNLKLPPIPPRALLTREEQLAIIQFAERASSYSPERRVELANHATPLTGTSGQAGVGRLLAIASWLQASADAAPQSKAH